MIIPHLRTNERTVRHFDYILYSQSVVATALIGPLRVAQKSFSVPVADARCWPVALLVYVANPPEADYRLVIVAGYPPVKTQSCTCHWTSKSDILLVKVIKQQDGGNTRLLRVAKVWQQRTA